MSPPSTERRSIPDWSRTGLWADDESRALLASIGSELVTAMAGVNVGRRRLLRARATAAAGGCVPPLRTEQVARSVADWARALTVIWAYAATLDDAGMAAVDEMLCALDDPTSPARELCHVVLTAGMGFADAEVQWEFAELRAAAYEPMRLVFDGDAAALRSMCACAFDGENGLLHVGFIGLGADPETTATVRACFARARRAGVTLSVFLLLPAMVLTAAELGEPDNPIRRAAADLAEKYTQFGRAG